VQALPAGQAELALLLI